MIFRLKKVVWPRLVNGCENSGQPQKVVIVTDNHVASLYAEKVKLSLEDAGFQVAVFDFLGGEERKNLTTVQKVYNWPTDGRAAQP